MDRHPPSPWCRGVRTYDYRAAGCVVLDASARILVLERPAREEWRLPKGHIDPGEDAARTALRETAEEAGYAAVALEADLGPQVVVFLHDGRVFRRLEHYFRARLDSELRIERPAEDRRQFTVHWLSAPEAFARLSYAAERNAVAKALASPTGLDRSPGSAR